MPIAPRRRKTAAHRAHRRRTAPPSRPRLPPENPGAHLRSPESSRCPAERTRRHRPHAPRHPGKPGRRGRSPRPTGGSIWAARRAGTAQRAGKTPPSRASLHGTPRPVAERPTRLCGALPAYTACLLHLSGPGASGRQSRPATAHSATEIRTRGRTRRSSAAPAASRQPPVSPQPMTGDGSTAPVATRHLLPTCPLRRPCRPYAQPGWWRRLRTHPASRHDTSRTGEPARSLAGRAASLGSLVPALPRGIPSRGGRNGAGLDTASPTFPHDA